MKTTSLARWAGLAIGLSVVLGVVLAGRVPQGTAQPPTHLSLVAEPATQLVVEPIGRDLLSRGVVRPGGAAVSGLVTISNLTSKRLDVRPVIHSSDRQLDGALRAEVLAGRRSLYSGALDGIRPGIRRLRLGARETRRIRVRISADGGAATEIMGRSSELRLGWATRGAGR